MIKYDRLWNLLHARGMSKNAFSTKYNISRSLMSRLNQNCSVNTNTLDRICNILECRIEDIMEHIPDNNRF
ncbi:MAG: helix-turn-helix transcriptional regulator [Erysipelotrichaceae bacterium]|nr:helix-turn-helix transcriptional regulator [Erysipelotrichaceae bacterium]